MNTVVLTKITNLPVKATIIQQVKKKALQEMVVIALKKIGKYKENEERREVYGKHRQISLTWSAERVG